METVLLSVICNTYNHEAFIEKAIKSFVMQKTDFKYEILIHDDASTDGTAQIIREYEQRYPDLIKAIYQKENQYSKGISISEINIGRAKGKYIAVCEGDDYWTDPYKLKKQADYMESHPECALCVHAFYIDTSHKRPIFRSRAYKGDRVFTTEEIIEGGGGLFMTNSMFYPLKYREKRPSFFELAPVGDYPLVINLSLLGTVYYMDECMSAYRTGVPNSWTAKNTSTLEKLTSHYQKIAVMLDDIDQYTNGKYNDAITRRKYQNQLQLLLAQGRYKEAKSGENKEHYLALSYKKRCFMFINHYCPLILKFARFLKRGGTKWVMR